jgi:hypothetical protein
MELDEILERMEELRNRKLYEQGKDPNQLEWCLSKNIVETLLESNLNTLNEHTLTKFYGIRVSNLVYNIDDWIHLTPIIE